ncbi:hypothetical protein ENBRE01_2101 [Enteropsectra breve]|nr:hypothetical protein ENBRE01_2101 [Enteropsectra breve]
MVNRTLTNEERQQIVNLYLNGHIASQISNIMGIRRTTVSEVIRVFNSEGRVIASPRGGVRERKLTDEMRTAIRSWIDADCGLSLKSLSEKVEADFGLTVSKSTIDRCISAFNYSFKRTSLIPERRNCPSTIEKRVRLRDHCGGINLIIDTLKFNI